MTIEASTEEFCHVFNNTGRPIHFQPPMTSVWCAFRDEWEDRTLLGLYRTEKAAIEAMDQDAAAWNKAHGVGFTSWYREQREIED